MAMAVGRLLGLSTTLVQVEISQQLLVVLPQHLVQIFKGGKCSLTEPLAWLQTLSLVLSFRLLLY